MPRSTKLTDKQKRAIEQLCDEKGWKPKPSATFTGPYVYHYENHTVLIDERAKTL